MIKRVPLVCAGLGLAAACGGDESDYRTQTNPPYASLAVSQLAGIGYSVGLASPDGAASGIVSLGNLAQNIITPVLDEQQSRVAPSVVPLVGDCVCDDSGCHFDGCSDEAGSWTIDGSIEMSGETYGFDVSVMQHYESEGTSSETEMTTSGEIAISATEIDGHVSGRIESDLVFSDEDGDTHVSSWFDWDITANQIGLDANRCALSGDLDASVSAEAASGGRDADYNGSGTVLFGPACGDAVVAQ